MLDNPRSFKQIKEAMNKVNSRGELLRLIQASYKNRSLANEIIEDIQEVENSIDEPEDEEQGGEF